MVKQFIQKNREVFTEDSNGDVALRAVLEGTTGDLTVNGDLTVTGSSNVGIGGTLQDQLLVDFTDAEAFLVRKDNDGGDILTVDTSEDTVVLGDGSTGVSLNLNSNNYVQWSNPSWSVRRVDTPNYANFALELNAFGSSGSRGIAFRDSDSTNVVAFADVVNERFGINTSSPSHPLDVDDSNGNALMDVREGDTTVFYNGIDAGPIQAAEDTYQQLIDQNVTNALTAGDQVGYTFAVDNNSIVEVSAEADGGGSIQNEKFIVNDTNTSEELRLSHGDFGGANNVSAFESTGTFMVFTVDGENHFEIVPSSQPGGPTFRLAQNTQIRWSDQNNEVVTGGAAALRYDGANENFEFVRVANGDETIFSASSTNSAVNHVDVANAATTNPPTISAVGDDTDIDLVLATKGSGTIQTITDIDLFANTLGGDKATINKSGNELRFFSDDDIGLYPGNSQALLIDTEKNLDTSAGTGRQHNRVTVSSAQTLGFDEYVSADTSGGSFTLTLPSVGSEDDGHAIHIKRNGANNLTVDASDSDTVDDGASVSFTSDNEAKTFIYNHSNTDWEEF